MDYKSPGVYVEEVSSGVKPIAGVGTSVGAFIGITEKGTKIDEAVYITNWSQYVDNFGGFSANAYLPYAVYSFFAEGGTSCWVVKVVPTGAVAAYYDGIKDEGGTTPVLDLKARSVGKWGNRITVIIEDASNNKNADGTPIDTKLFKLMVKYLESDQFQSEYEGEGLVEIYDKLSLPEMEEKLKDSAFLEVVKENIRDFNKRPKNGTYPLDNGADNNFGGVGFKDADFIGNEKDKNGLHALDLVDEVNIIAIPDKAGDRDVIAAALLYCKNRRDCFFIADPPYEISFTDVVDFKTGKGPTYEGNSFDSSYGALYYPWVYINDPATGRKKLVPPSGVVAGTYAYTDSTRGVHKAPAGVAEGYLDSVAKVEKIITKVQQESLNPEGINVIRPVENGICIWGARTLSSDKELVYVNIRRLLMFIEESIDKGTQWVVFEPNDPSLWGKVKRNLTAFLTKVWRDGALYGSTPEEAFFVKVDAENNPPEVRDLGQLIIEVGVAPVKPAEFVIIKVSQKILAK